MAVNIAALVRLTRLALPGWSMSPRKNQLNITRTAAFQPGPLMAILRRKAFVLSFAEDDRAPSCGAPAVDRYRRCCPGPTLTDFQNRRGLRTRRCSRRWA